jgi:hypothetical protein
MRHPRRKSSTRWFRPHQRRSPLELKEGCKCCLTQRPPHTFVSYTCQTILPSSLMSFQFSSILHTVFYLVPNSLMTFELAPKFHPTQGKLRSNKGKERDILLNLVTSLWCPWYGSWISWVYSSWLRSMQYDNFFKKIYQQFFYSSSI